MSMPSIYLPIPCMLMRRAALFSASSALSLPLTFPQPGLDRPFHSSKCLLRVFLCVSAPPRQIYVLTPPGLPPQYGYPASISSATRFLISCRATLASDRVDFVHEHDAGRVALGLVEEV